MRHHRPRFLLSLVLLGLLLNAGPAHTVQFRTVPIEANDVVYNPTDGMLYVSVPGSATLHPNSITRVDPVSLAIGPSVPIGSEPHRLALSEDGTVLWVGLDGAGAIRSLDLTTFIPGPQRSLGNDPFTGPLFAADLEVLPGSRTAVVVALRNQGYSPSHEGVAVFDDGVPRPNRTPGHTGSNIIVFGSSAARLYGQNIETTEFGFRRMNVDASGVTELDVTRDLLNGFGGDIFYEAGRVYSTGGEVIDPEARTLLGRFPFPDFSYGSAMAPGGDRAYFAMSSFFVSAVRIRAYDTGTFTQVFDYGVPGASGTPTTLRRWGADGLALRTSEGDLVVMSDVSSPPTCDLAVSLQGFLDPVAVDDLFNQRIGVRNQGAAAAEQVVIRSLLSGPVSYYYSSNPRGFCYDSLGTIVCTGGTLAVGDSFSIHVTLRAAAVGTALHQTTVTSTTLDGNPSNNTASLATQIVPRGANASDLYVTFLEAPPVSLVEGQSFEHTIEFGNRGPSDAAGARLLGAFYGSDAVVEVLSGPAGCTPNEFGTLDCALGLVPASNSATMRVRIHVRSPGYIGTNYYVTSPGPDNDYSNNSVSMVSTVLPSAERLIGDLRTTVGQLDLNAGERNVLDRKLAEAIAALADPDTSSACHDLDNFLAWMSRWTGRALDLDQSYALTVNCRMIQEVLACSGPVDAVFTPANLTTPEDGGGPVRDGSPLSVVADPDATLLESGGSDPEAAPPTALALRVGGVLGKPSILMPGAGRARLDLLDVQGRLVRTVFDGELAAGTHAIYGDLRQLPSGVYLYRLSALGRQALAKVTVVR